MLATWALTLTPCHWLNALQYVFFFEELCVHAVVTTLYLWHGFISPQYSFCGRNSVMEHGIPRTKHSKNQLVLHRLLCLCPKRIQHSVLPGYLLNELDRRWITSGRCTVVQLACWNCCGFHDWCWSGFGQPCQIRLPQCCHHWKVISSS